jgi:hypothetical protein
VTDREFTPEEILAVLGDGGEDSVLRTCIEALRVHHRAHYTIGGTPANLLRRTLERRYRNAVRKGKTFVGGQEILQRLAELGSELVSGLSTQDAGRHFFIYLYPSTLEPIGAMIMSDGTGVAISGGSP